MDIKRKLSYLLLLAGSTTIIQSNAATINVGTYSFDDSMLANTVISANGQSYNGSEDYYASNNSWYSYNYESSNPGWESTNTPSELTDTNAYSFLASESTVANQLSVELGFSNASIANGDGADIALFFLWDQSNSNTTVSINGTTQSLTYSNVFDDAGIQQTAKNIAWNGSVYSDVQLMVATIDLLDFEYALDDTLASSVLLELSSTDSNPAALSMVAGLNTALPPSPVPVPAAAWLFITGLLSLGFVSRRKR